MCNRARLSHETEKACSPLARGGRKTPRDNRFDLASRIQKRAYVICELRFWLLGPYDEVVALQRLYPADEMTMLGPAFPTRIKGQK